MVATSLWYISRSLNVIEFWMEIVLKIYFKWIELKSNISRSLNVIEFWVDIDERMKLEKPESYLNYKSGDG